MSHTSAAYMHSLNTHLHPPKRTRSFLNSVQPSAPQLSRHVYPCKTSTQSSKLVKSFPVDTKMGKCFALTMAQPHVLMFDLLILAHTTPLHARSPLVTATPPIYASDHPAHTLLLRPTRHGVTSNSARVSYPSHLAKC
jgi:hypothetical protein